VIKKGVDSMNKRIYQQILDYKPFNERESLDREVMLDYISNTEDILTRENKIAHMTTSAWIVNKERTKVLMIYHNIYDSWAWVGGHADGDEDLIHVAKKEIEEETGIKNVKLLLDGIYGLNVITVDNHIKRGKVVNSHLHFDIEFLFEADENDMIRIKEDENSGVRWINLDEVEKYSSEEKMKPIYRTLTEKLKNI
jgi:ADP-ribose pyrophosphatase YjhB (NUDIX family)